MPKFSLTLPESITVTKRDGSTATVGVARVDPGVAQRALEAGLAEHVRDTSSGALAAAYDAAHPDLTDEQRKAVTPAERKAWGEANPDAVRAESTALMEQGVASLYDGTALTGGGAGRAMHTPLEVALYEAAYGARHAPAFSPVATVLAQMKGATTTERRDAVLECIESGLSDKAKAALHKAAKAQLARAADLAALDVE